MDELLRYYKNYFLDYWEIKYYFLKNEITNYKSQKDLLSIPNYKSKFLSMLKFDLHFMKFQLIETLFNFIFALENKDDKDLFFRLAFPEEKSQRSFAAYDKISGLNDMMNIDSYFKKEVQVNGYTIPLWQYLFFFNIDNSEIQDNFELIEENIISLLFQLASTFSDREDYSSYKHSLRCYSSSLTLSIRPRGTDEFIPLGEAKDGMNYLTKTEREGDTIVNRTFKAFSIEEDSYYIERAIELLKNIVNTRISYFFKEKLTEIYYFKDLKKKYPNYSIIRLTTSSVSVKALFTQAFRKYSTGDFNEAIPIYEKILRLDASHYETIFQLGYCYLLTQNLDKAILYFEKYIKNTVAEHWKEGLYNLALCYYRKRELEKSVKLLSQCLKKNPEDNVELSTAARFLLADVFLELNQLHFMKHGKNKSNFIKKAEKLLKKTEEIEFKHPEIWFKLAYIKDHLKKKNESKEIYEKIITLGTNSIGSLINLSQIYYLDNQIDKMEELIIKALEIDDKHSNTWIAYGAVKEKQGKMDKFYDAIKKALDFSRNDEERKIAFNAFGQYYFKIENYAEALNYFKKSYEIDQSFEQPFLGIIQSLWKLARYDEIVEFTKDITIDASQAYALKFRAYALSKIKNFDEAIEIINKLIPLVSEENEILSDLHDTLGDIYREKGEKEKAIEYYQKTLDISENEYSFISETRSKLNELISLKG